MKPLISAFLVVFTLVGCASATRAPEMASVAAPGDSSAPDSNRSSGPEFGAWGVDLSAMDTSVKPGDDFYRYVNGTWQEQATIPGDKQEVGPAASLQDLALGRVKLLLDEAAADTDAVDGSEWKKLGDYYASMMD